MDCSQNCTCPEIGAWNVHCENETGLCSCQDGYHGQNCSLQCENGYFGRNCSEKCMCQNNSPCSPVNGACNCSSPGWTGDFCERGRAYSYYIQNHTD
ncbi:hypothetical protein FSP39_009391 [Pinctada imbricata]|uniref:Laminin EGF-like domain-containing protein n=1 Tax=Pinctada imbricata TaxID=66713 RepID=A0AA89BJ41_PINIB|nr:hypothetical protein FSP39_009391 [Pinctada imbricata]